MLNYHHEPTNTRIETDTGTVSSGGRRFDKINVQTNVVGLNRTVYEETEILPAFEAQDVHICTGGVPDPDRIRVHVQEQLPLPAYVYVNIADHTNVYMPIEMAEAIAAALAAKAVAS